MKRTRKHIRLRTTVPPAALQWSVTLSESSIDKGDSVDLTVAVNLNGYTPAPGEIATVTLTTMTAPDYAAEGFAETQAFAVNGDLADGYTEDMQAEIVGNGGTGDIVTVNGINAVVLGFKLGTFTSATITRVSLQPPSDAGDKRLVHQILTPSSGTLAADQASCVFVDGYVPPVGSDLASITLSNAFVEVWGPKLGPAAGVEIGRLIYKDSGGSVLTPTVAPTLVNDAGGRFAIHDYNDGSSRYALRHTAVKADFEDITSSYANYGQLLSYTIVVSAVIGAVTITPGLTLYKRYTAIAPTGDGTATNVTYTTGDGFKNAVNAGGNNRTILPGAVSGVLRKSSYSGDIIADDSNITFRGTPQTAINHRKGMLIRGVNQVWEDMAIGVGTSDATPTAQKDIDNAEIGTGLNEPNFAWDILFQNCVLFASNDELIRSKHRARRILFRYCIFAYPFAAANHTKGGQHNHGPAASDRCGHIIFDKCLMWGMDTRAVQVQTAFGFVQVNCVVGHWKSDQAAARFVGGRDNLATAEPMDTIVEANLFAPRLNDAAHRSGTIEFEKVQEANSHCHVPQSGNRANRFIHPEAGNLFGDVLTVANGAIAFSNSSSSAALKATPNFEYLGVTVMPTSTLAECTALFDHVMANAGNGSNLCNDVIEQAEAGVNLPDQFVSPEEFEALYGGPDGTGLRWMGGGTKGHGVAGTVV